MKREDSAMRRGMSKPRAFGFWPVLVYSTGIWNWVAVARATITLSNSADVSVVECFIS